MNSSATLKILLIDDQEARAQEVREQLTAEGYPNHQHLKICDLHKSGSNDVKPELLIIANNCIDFSTLVLVKAMVQLSDSPSLVFTEDPIDYQTSQQLVELGASCYQAVDPASIPLKALIDNSRDHFNNFHRLQQKLAVVQSQLADRKQIERAKGLLMKKHACDEEQAYVAMRKLAMDRAQSMGVVAKELIYALNNQPHIVPT
ncbi:MAG: ANTAR domain-containing protein [Motiliproteus sp.]